MRDEGKVKEKTRYHRRGSGASTRMIHGSEEQGKWADKSAFGERHAGFVKHAESSRLQAYCR